MTGFPQATEGDDEEEKGEERRKRGRTDDGLGDLDGSDEGMFVEGGSCKGEVVVGCLAVKRIDVGGETNSGVNGGEMGETKKARREK